MAFQPLQGSGLRGLPSLPLSYQTPADPTSQTLELYYYVPLSEHHNITTWIEKNISGCEPWQFNLCFTKYAARLLTHFRDGSSNANISSDGEVGVTNTLTHGFPNTNAEDYIAALEWYRGSTWALKAATAEKEGRPVIPAKERGDLKAVREARYHCWTQALSSEQKESAKDLYGVDTIKTMISGRDLEDATSVGKVDGTAFEGLV